MDEIQNLDVERNAFWLLGVDDDFYTIQQIKVNIEQKNKFLKYKILANF